MTFVPPHLAEKLADDTEMDHMVDEWGHTMLREGKYTPGQIDAKWTPKMIEEFNAWLEKRVRSSACRSKYPAPPGVGATNGCPISRAPSAREVGIFAQSSLCRMFPQDPRELLRNDLIFPGLQHERTHLQSRPAFSATNHDRGLGVSQDF